MTTSTTCVVMCAGVCALLASTASAASPFGASGNRPTYHIEAVRGGRDLRARFTDWRLGILEQLNRMDGDHLGRARELVVPDEWTSDELAYSPFPALYVSASTCGKLLIVDQPAQAFAAYEAGRLVRWGPVSSGRRGSVTPDGLFHLNWKSRGRHSTLNPDWFMPWYFNFENRIGLSLHQYSLPGRPASHACIRLLERDARWLFEWGEESLVSRRGTIVKDGTPLRIVGQYDFGAPPPWRSPALAGLEIELPADPLRPT